MVLAQLARALSEATATAAARASLVKGGHLEAVVEVLAAVCSLEVHRTALTADAAAALQVRGVGCVQRGDEAQGRVGNQGEGTYTRNLATRAQCMVQGGRVLTMPSEPPPPRAVFGTGSDVRDISDTYRRPRARRNSSSGSSSHITSDGRVASTEAICG